MLSYKRRLVKANLLVSALTACLVAVAFIKTNRNAILTRQNLILTIKNNCYFTP